MFRNNFKLDELFKTLVSTYAVELGGLCNIILKMFNPKSIIDFGCGTADILAPFEKRGIIILGIDGSKAVRRHLKIDKDNFLLFDLRKTYRPEKRYDLCLCLELAEHIEDRYSDILVDNLVNSSRIIIFSVAPPGQGGYCHYNEKPYEWWIEKFCRFGFEYSQQLTDILKEEIENIPGVQSWYINNLLIFKSN